MPNLSNHDRFEQSSPFQRITHRATIKVRIQIEILYFQLNKTRSKKLSKQHSIKSLEKILYDHKNPYREQHTDELTKSSNHQHWKPHLNTTKHTKHLKFESKLKIQQLNSNKSKSYTQYLQGWLRKETKTKLRSIPSGGFDPIGLYTKLWRRPRGEAVDDRPFDSWPGGD